MPNNRGMGALPVTYRYKTASTLVSGDSGDNGMRLGLATTDPGAFLDGFVERADVVAAALLKVGDIAGTRFYTPPNMVAAALRAADPIVTVGDGAVRFESLSTDCGVAARLDLLDDGLDATTRRPGTTNVDVGPALRQLLAGVRRRDPMRLSVSDQGLGVQTLDGKVHERVVDLPERWVRSLAELQALASQMELAAELNAEQTRQFLRSIPSRSGREPYWLQQVPSGLRLSTSPGPHRVAVGSPERLRALQPLLRLATGLRVYGTESEAGAATWWTLDLPGARLGLALSPDLSRGFSGEGALLDDLAAKNPDVDRARRGLVGYDVVNGGFFERALPFDKQALESAPRLDKARRLIDQGKVRREGDHTLVAGSYADHVVWLRSTGESCTCQWFRKYHGTRGPCAHVLAARLLDAEGA